MLRRLLLFATTAVFAIPSDAAVTGMVMNTAGQPIAGAKVNAFAHEGRDERSSRHRSAEPLRKPLATATTNERGRFSIEVSKEIPVVMIQIDAAGHAPYSLFVERDDDTGAIAIASAELKSGRVTATGKPVAGAHVIWSSNSEVVATTDESGVYTVPDPSRWAYGATVIHPQFAAAHESVELPSRKARLDMALDGGVTLNGRVVAADGKTPVAGATVKAGLASATTREDGTFSIERVSSKWQVVEATHGTSSGRRMRGSDLTIRLAPSIAVRGVVKDASSPGAIAGASINIAQIGIYRTDSSQPTVVTDAKGNFTLPNVAPGSYSLFASHPAYRFAPLTVTIAAGDNTIRTLVGTRLARVSGAVVGEDRKSVAAARVSSQNVARRDFGGPPMMREPGVPVTAPDGTFTLRVGPDEDIQIEAHKRGFPTGRSATLRLSPGERKTGVVIGMPSGTPFAGRVVDGDGNPLRDVSIATTEAQTDSNQSRMIRRAPRLERDDDANLTAADGTFSMLLKEGAYDVVFRKSGFAPKILRAQRVAAGATPIDVTLDKGVEITGRVTRNGAALPDVRVGLFGDTVSEWVSTSADGSFRFTDLAPGQLMINVSKEGEFVRVSYPVKAPARDVDIKVPPGGRIAGRVVDAETKQPIASFEAGISSTRGGGGMVMMGPPELKAFTSDDGSFVLENVPEGTVAVVVAAGGYATATLPNLNVEEGRTLENVEVALGRGVKVTGRVTGPDGSALSGVSVHRSAERRTITTLGFFGVGAMTDDSGQYTMEAIEPGEHTFSFSRTGYPRLEKTVQLSGRETRVDAQLIAGIRVTGSVVTDSGSPVADAMITARTSAAAGTNNMTRSDASGNFQMDALSPGRYVFGANKQGMASTEQRDVDVTAATSVRLVLKSGGIIAGRITGLDASELAVTQVFASGPGGSASAAPDPNGVYLIEGSPVGTVRVSARVGTLGTARSSPQKSINVGAGETVQHDIDFTSGSIVRGRVTRNGRPVSSGWVSFNPRGGQGLGTARAQTNPDGHYEVSGLSDGEYTVTAGDLQGGTPLTTKFEVRGPSTFDIDMRSIAVRGRVVDASTGRGIDGAAIQIRTRDANAPRYPMSTIITDANGAFTLGDVNTGEYHVSAEKEGYGTRVVELNAGETAQDVEIKLSPNAGVTLFVIDARDNRRLGGNVRVFDAGNRIVYETPMRFGPAGLPDTAKIPVEPGTYRATITVSGYAPLTLTISSPGSFTARMTPGGVLIIRSRASEMRRAQLLVGGKPYDFRGSINPLFSIDPSPGVTQFQHVAPGTYTLQVLDARGSVAASEQVTVTEGGTTTVDI